MFYYVNISGKYQPLEYRRVGGGREGGCRNPHQHHHTQGSREKEKEIKRSLMSSMGIPGVSGDITMTTKIPQHKHCILCGRAVQVDEDYCGDECKNLYDQRMAKRKQTLYFYMAAAFIIILFVLIS